MIWKYIYIHICEFNDGKTRRNKFNFWTVWWIRFLWFFVCILQLESVVIATVYRPHWLRLVNSSKCVIFNANHCFFSLRSTHGSNASVPPIWARKQTIEQNILIFFSCIQIVVLNSSPKKEKKTTRKFQNCAWLKNEVTRTASGILNDRLKPMHTICLNNSSIQCSLRRMVLLQSTLKSKYEN